MEKINNTVKVYAQFITFLVIWAVIAFVTKTYQTNDLLNILKLIPQAITGYLFVALLFSRWIWKLKILQGWLIKVPNLQGTWKGEIKSDWINPETGKGVDPIPVILVIRQTFSTIKCTLMTKESTSYSTTADITLVPSSEDLSLTYNYTNRSKATIRDRSPIHDGASILKIIKSPKRILEGEYWTSRKTRGEMHLEFYSKVLSESFNS
ncbi:MAG: hypothetical protein RI935_342 [Candidatus Parcubacteria bacterium]|jgi:hypothetical protein